MNPVPSAPVPTPPKKGMSGLAIAGFGCLGLVIVMGLVGIFAIRACTKEVSKIAGNFQKNPAKATAMLVIGANPDLEIVKTDDAAGEITVRDKKSGEVMTLSFNDVSQGKFKWKTSKGEEVTFDYNQGKDGSGRVVVKNKEGTTTAGGQDEAAPPTWLPVYPGLDVKTGGGMRVEKTDSVSGLFSGETQDAPAKVKDFYEPKLKEAGFKTETSNGAGNNIEVVMVKATKEDGKTKVQITVTQERNKKTLVVVQYDGPKS